MLKRVSSQYFFDDKVLELLFNIDSARTFYTSTAKDLTVTNVFLY